MAGIGWAGARPLGLALAACALTANIAGGHAVLQRAEPRVESRLKRAPDEIKLYFTERLEPAYSSVRVLNDHGGQVDRQQVGARPDFRSTLVEAHSRGGCAAGQY